MRIAQVAPLYESVPPSLYGGTERIVSFITEELVESGHDVTLFASGDSQTRARLIAPCQRSLRMDENLRDQLAPHIAMLELVSSRLDDFDIVHWHIDYLHYPFSAQRNYTHVTTLHGRLDLPELRPVYEAYPTVPLVSISNNQRRPLPMANWVDTIYHGLPEQLHKFQPAAGDYLINVGRICPEKRVDRAIEIAVKAGLRLKIAAKVDRADKDYFAEQIKPLLSHSLVEYVGEVDEAGKDELLGNALAQLFPIDWPEPFGMVMIESFALGTPVIAWPHGSVPEIIQPGLNGFIVESIDEAVAAVQAAAGLDRSAIRRSFEQRFTARRMAQDYVAVYERLKDRSGHGQGRQVLAGAAGDHPA